MNESKREAIVCGIVSGITATVLLLGIYFSATWFGVVGLFVWMGIMAGVGTGLVVYYTGRY